MAKRHQGAKPTYESLKAQGKVMTPEGEIATIKKRVPGKGGGKQGVSGDLNVWGRFTGDSSDRTKNRKKVSAKKTAKRKGDSLYGDWLDSKKPVPSRKGKKIKGTHPIGDRKKKIKRKHPIGDRSKKISGQLM